MARIILGSYFVRYPLGGNLSCVLQYLLGIHRLGHEIYFVEKSGYADSCYDVPRNMMTDDCTYGISIVNALLARFGLEHRWCYVDAANCYHGMSKREIDEVFRSADVFIEMGTHEAWLEEAERARLRVLVDGDPGFSQMWMENRSARGEWAPEYDYYFTVGRNVGTERSTAPTAGKIWHPSFHPVDVDLFPPSASMPEAPFTTIMNWKSYSTVEYRGVTYGHKNDAFETFVNLPSLVESPLELAVAGHDLPSDRLSAAGWRLRDAHAVTISFDSYARYVGASRGEFSVCKQGFVATNCGWFGDRNAVYLASGRPVIQQDTGFSDHLPTGCGLFAVRDADEAAMAILEITRDYARHSAAAREIAREYLHAPVVMKRLFDEIGV
jgi:hypothetical protein